MFACVKEHNENEELLDDFIDKEYFYSELRFRRKLHTCVAGF